MAFRKRGEVAVAEVPRTLVASAAQINIDDLSWNSYRFRNAAWQRELWRLYDIVPEFRFICNHIGSACSRVRIYVANVDRLGSVGAEVDDKADKRIAAIGDTVFGGPTGKSEALRLCGVNMTAAGEFYIAAKPSKKGNKDEWHILTPAELQRREGAIYAGDRTNVANLIEEGSSILTRVWTPHPARVNEADCAARAAMQLLRELEQLTKYVFSQIDSRLIGAGVMFIPNDMDFPSGDEDISASDSLTKRLAEAAKASLKGEGTAAAVVPIIVEVPPETLGKIQLVNFAAELSKQALELRAEAIRRLGMSMDISMEALLGTGDASHWNMWHIAESDVKIHIEPLMARICEALTRVYLRPALELIGKDPDRYTFWFDTSPLTVRPQRLTDALNLHEKGLISGEAVRSAGFFRKDEAPDEDEDVRRYVRELMLRDPALFALEGVRLAAGITADILPPELVTPPPPPPAPETGIQQALPAPMPDEEKMGELPRNQAAEIVASAGRLATDRALAVAADATVRRALELAGNRLMTPLYRVEFSKVPRHELHTAARRDRQSWVTDEAHAERLLSGAWVHLTALVDQWGAGVDVTELENVLNDYCVTLLTKALAHDPDYLLSTLRQKAMIQL